MRRLKFSQRTARSRQDPTIEAEADGVRYGCTLREKPEAAGIDRRAVIAFAQLSASMEKSSSVSVDRSASKVTLLSPNLYGS
jgi:hypothetical protein